MRKVKWGVLGTADIARGCTIPGMKQVEDCELYAIAGRSAEKACTFKEDFGFKVAYSSYEDLIADKDVQAVYIPLPNDIHLKWVKEALRSGKHVLCEKPLALNLKEAEEMSSGNYKQEMMSPKNILTGSRIYVWCFSIE